MDGDGEQDDWDTVAAVLKVPRIERKGDLMLDSDLAGLQAAEQGLGVTIGFTPVIHEWLRSGRLVQLVEPIPMREHAHWFVYRESVEKDEVAEQRLRGVYAWIKARYDALAAINPRT